MTRKPLDNKEKKPVQQHASTLSTQATISRKLFVGFLLT